MNQRLRALRFLFLILIVIFILLSDPWGEMRDYDYDYD